MKITHSRTRRPNLLLERGASIQAYNLDVNTALHLAAQFGRVEDVYRLIVAGADVRAKNRYAQTPLALAEYTRSQIRWDTLFPTDAAMVLVISMLKDAEAKQ